MLNGSAHFEHVDAPDHFIHRSKTELGHPLANFLRDKEKEIDDMLRRAVELLPQFGILRGNTDGTRIQMALAHHDAAKRNQRSGGKAELFRSE